MVKNEIIWTEYAYGDLEGILDHINYNNPENVSTVYQKILSKIRSLETFSAIGRTIPELEGLNISIFREMFEDPWRIFYRIEARRVYILAVFDGRRDLEEVIIKRLLFEKR